MARIQSNNESAPTSVITSDTHILSNPAKRAAIIKKGTASMNHKLKSSKNKKQDLRKKGNTANITT